MMTINLLKIHLFLLYGSIACLLVFLTVYLKTYTDATYDEIGYLMMLCSLTSSFSRPLVCSFADQHHNYKRCLLVSLLVLSLSTVPLSILPLYPQLLFDEPHPRLIWHLVALLSMVGSNAFGVAVTLTDVFVIHKCLNSTSGEYFGQYRFVGALGWAAVSICLAVTEKYDAGQVPHLGTPMAASGLIALADLLVMNRVSNIAGRRSEHSSLGGGIAMAGPRFVERHVAAADKRPPSLSFATVEPNRLNQQHQTPVRLSLPIAVTTTAAAVAAAAGAKPPIGATNPALGPNDTSSATAAAALPHRPSSFGSGRGSDQRQQISRSSQLDLLLRLNKHDHYNLIKYGLAFAILGAFQQCHYVFHLQFMTEILKERQLFSMLFTFSGLVQVADCAGMALSLLCIARLLIRYTGRDLALLACLGLSGLRYAISAYYLDHINIWLIALLEVQTGLVFGILYTLIAETGSCYLSLLDKLLLVETEAPSSEHELKFVARLEELKELHSIDSIRFALKATIQSIWSCCEGLGHALGPLLAGLWLHSNGNSFRRLYRDAFGLHLVLLLALGLLEFGLIRLVFGARSRVDRMKIAHQHQSKN